MRLWKGKTASVKKHNAFKARLDELGDAYLESMGEVGAYREFVRMVEKEAFLYFLDLSDQNVMAAAKAMGMERSSAYSLGKRVGVERFNERTKYKKGDYYIVVRSYDNPRVDVMFKGKTVERFEAESVEISRAMARSFCAINGITVLNEA